MVVLMASGYVQARRRHYAGGEDHNQWECDLSLRVNEV